MIVSRSDLDGTFAGHDPLDELGAWVEQRSGLPERWRSAEPFPHVVIDGFLDDELARALLEDFPGIESMPRSRDYVFGDKRELSSIERTPSGARFHALVTSPAFADLLGEICGHEVFVDPAFHGGGYHQGGDGSYLDVHVDFNVHPLHPSWLRTLNILLYLNEPWEPSWGGQLVLKADPDSEAHLVAPTFNRGVIMLTSDATYHGYRRVSLPPGVSRRSIATYAYRSIDEGSVRSRTTGWAPEDAGPIKRLFARHYDRLVALKGRWFGSGTAGNR